MISLRGIARHLAQPWLPIAAGALWLAAIALGQPRYVLALPAHSIAPYSEPGVFVAQAPAPTWPDWLFRLGEDGFDGAASRLALYEDGRALGPAHTAVIDIGARRDGRFAHWEGKIYFAASDGSDPRRNGRSYVAKSPLNPQWPAWAIGWALIGAGAIWQVASARRRAAAFAVLRAGAQTAQRGWSRSPMPALVRRLARPALPIALGAIVLAFLAAGQPRYSVIVPSDSISEYSDGVYVAELPRPRWPDWLLRLQHDDRDGQHSRLVLYEDGTALGPGHSGASDIAAHPDGRFSHWPEKLYFSASDGGDPRRNGREYAVESPLQPQWPAWAIGWALLCVGVAWHLAAAARRAATLALLRRIWRPTLYAAALAAGGLWLWIAAVGVHQVVPLTDIAAAEGHAYRAYIPPPSGLYAWLPRRSDEDRSTPRASTLLLENGAVVGFPRAPLDTVERMGGGRYLYHRGHFFFSTVDGSDPRSNGRSYAARVRLTAPVWFRAAALTALLLAMLAAAWQFRAHARWIAGALAAASGAAALWAIATQFNLVSFDDFVLRARITPSTATAFVTDHREIVAPFVTVAPPGKGRVYLVSGGDAVACGASLSEPSLRPDGARCARRENGYQVDFEPPAGVDPRVNEEPYSVRLPVRAHPYLIGALLLATALFAAIAVYRPSLRPIVAGGGAALASLGLLLMAANLAGLFLPLRHPDLAALATTFGPGDLSMSYEEALHALERRPDDTDAAYAERATLALSQAVVHAAPATELDKWRMHVPIWENWALHLLGLVDAKARRYVFWDARKHLERGIGLCGDLSAILVAFLRDNGIEARVASVSGHVVATAEVEPGLWRLYDPDYGLVVPHALEEVEQNPQLLQSAYARWADAHPELDAYTRDYAARIVPSFFASAEDNSIDVSGRDGFYSTMAPSTEAFVAREALFYRIKWIVPAALLLLGFAIALAAWRWPRRPAD